MGNPTYSHEAKIKTIFRLKMSRSNSINDNINNNIRQKEFNSVINNNISSLMNMRQNNKLYLIKLKEREKDLIEDRTFQKNILPPNRNKKNKENERYKINKENPFTWYQVSIKDDTYKNSSNLDYNKTKEYSNEQSKNKLF